MLAANVKLSMIGTDEEWEHTYLELSRILMVAAAKAYERRELGEKRMRRRNTSVVMQALIRILRNLNSAIRFEVSGGTISMRHDAQQMSREWRLEFDLANTSGMSPESNLYLQFLRSKRKSLNSDILKRRAKEALDRQKGKDQGKIKDYMNGGSASKCMGSKEMVNPPMAVEDANGSLVTDPQGVLQETKEYYDCLYAKPEGPAGPRPWMETESVQEVRKKVDDDPFAWPIEMRMEDLRAVLAKGNPKPSPGPDRWEKWMIRKLPDEIMRIILELSNYTIRRASFPDIVRKMEAMLIYKRGDRTSLNNWRAVTFSNFLLNLSPSWLNMKLLPYANRLGIIPDTQIATRIGTQLRDQTSFLAQVQCWAKRTNQQILVLKRDQMKGFDYLAEHGFHDALEAYGLTQEVAVFDKAAQHMVECRVRTAYGLTDVIVMDGVTKQGGPLSPLKSTMTTSMGHRYLLDKARKSADALVIKTKNALEGRYHVPEDDIRLEVVMTEATDDSNIFARTITFLQEQVLEQERFQYTYNWSTSWKKTVAYLIGNQEGFEDTEEITILSIDPADPLNTSKTVRHQVKLVKNELEFLRTHINDSGTRTEELKDIINCFSFPRMSVRLPLTFVNKIANRCIMPKIRARLVLQPLLPAHARELDAALAKKIREFVGGPFAPSKEILSLPVEEHGFGFPSIERMNASIAVEGLLRDLNHQIPAYQRMARVTLADWRCSINSCVCPLSTRPEKAPRLSILADKITVTWVTAWNTIQRLGDDWVILDTDQSYIREGRVALKHLVCMVPKESGQKAVGRSPKPDQFALKVLQNRNCSLLVDMILGWSDDGYPLIKPYTHHVKDKPRDRLKVEKRWNEVADWIKCHHISEFMEGPVLLSHSREDRYQSANNMVQAQILTSARQPSEDWGAWWATDGSMVPAEARRGEKRRVTASITGKYASTWKLGGNGVSVMHGEVFALTCAHLASRDGAEANIYSDHLNAVRLLDLVDNGCSTRIPTTAKSSYRWLLQVRDELESKPIVKHVHSHTGGSSTECRMNDEADRLAAMARGDDDEVVAPFPTFALDKFCIYNDNEHFIEGGIGKYVERLLAVKARESLGDVAGRMNEELYQKHTPPYYQYCKSTSSFSIEVQLLARSGQLDTKFTRWQRKMEDANEGRCEFGCGTMGTAHHVFAECKRFEALRVEAKDLIIGHTRKMLQELGQSSSKLGENLLRIAGNLFQDGVEWPGGVTEYYYGKIPKLDLRFATNMEGKSRKKLMVNLCNHWHETGVRLAGRIWGIVLRERAKMKRLQGWEGSNSGGR